MQETSNENRNYRLRRHGGGLGKLWAAKGHSILFSDAHDATHLPELAAAAGPTTQTGSPADATDFGEVALLTALIQTARKKKESGYVGEGRNLWPTVHRLDLTRLFRLALENGKAGGVYHGVGEEGIPFREIAEVIGKRLGVPVVSRPASHFGFLAPFAPADNPASSQFTQEVLGWNPSGPNLMTDLAGSDYFRA